MELLNHLRWAQRDSPWVGYLAAALLTALAGAARVLADQWLSGVQFITFFPTIVLTAYLFGTGPGLTSVVLSSIMGWYFFLNGANLPHGNSSAGAYSLLLFILVASLIAISIGRARETVRRLIKAQSALATSEDRYSRIFHQVHDLVFTADLDLVVTDCNPATSLALGLPAERLVGATIGEFVSEEGLRQAQRMLDQKLAYGGTTRHDIEVRNSSGKILTWEVSSGLALDDFGEVIGLHAIARDVTEKLQAEERQILLINELNHRVKNTLALVQGLALQSFSDRNDLQTGRVVFQERLTALAKAHDLLTRENWVGATVKDVAEEATAHLGAVRKQISIDGPLIRIDAKAAVSLVMVIHELSTNASKYGALSTEDGRVGIQWSGTSSEDLSFEWKERGGPLVGLPGRKGFGLKLIERVAASDFQRQAVWAFAPEGFSCKMGPPSTQCLK